MVKLGAVGATARMCEVKFANMKATYKTISARLGPNAESSWRFYDAMAELFKDDPSVHPDNVIEAGADGYSRKRPARTAVRFSFFFFSLFTYGSFIIIYFKGQFDPWVASDEDEDGQDARMNPVRRSKHKRKRISNAETIEMMLQSEREQRPVNDKMLDLLQAFKQQGDQRLEIMTLFLTGQLASPAQGQNGPSSSH